MSAISLSNLSYNYGDKAALKDLSFSIEPGRFCALLGPNGAGKSTLFSLLTRLLLPRSGQITVAGADLGREPRAALGQTGVVFQQSTLDLDMSVSRNLMYFAGLQGIRKGVAQKRIDAALDRLGMRERALEKVRSLNGGHRRRMEIARALIHNPKVLLLDEPTVGLDAQSRSAITQHVHDLADDGLAVLWATHLVDEVSGDDDLIILHQGRILAQGQAASVAGDKTLLQAFLDMTGRSTAA